MKSAESKLNSCKLILAESDKEKAVISDFMKGVISQIGEEPANIARKALDKGMSVCYALPKVAALTEKFSRKQLKLIEDVTLSMRSLLLSKSEVDLQANSVKIAKAFELVAPILKKFLN